MGGGYESVQAGGNSNFCFPFGSPRRGKSATSIDEPFLLEDSRGIPDCLCLCRNPFRWDICYDFRNANPVKT